MLVSDLIVSESADWNVEKIKLYLPQYEDLIMKLVPSACDMSDNLVWLPENSGNYTTKTGYALAKINVAGTEMLLIGTSVFGMSNAHH